MLARTVDIQRIIDNEELPSDRQLQCWVNKALQGYQHDAEVVIRLVDEAEMLALNTHYRAKHSTTNILSFPFEIPEGIDTIDLLGDLVVCVAVLAEEAHKQGKNLMDHWAHIIIHGVLHLLGYDHIDLKEAEEMEALEVELLQQLTIDNPYLER